MSTRYIDEPKCRLCYHPRVVHRGKEHTAECAAIDCPYGCKAFKFAPIGAASTKEDGDVDVAPVPADDIAGAARSHPANDATPGSGSSSGSTPARDDPEFASS